MTSKWTELREVGAEESRSKQPDPQPLSTPASQLHAFVRSWKGTLMLGVLGLLALTRIFVLSPPPHKGTGVESYEISLPTLNRTVNVSVWKPARGLPRGSVYFSHGFRCSPSQYSGLLTRWARAGFRVFAPLHTDSDEYPASGRTGGAEALLTRLQDSEIVVERMLSHVPGGFVATGHSYGSLIALILGGAEIILPEGLSSPPQHRKTQAVIAMSPSPYMPVLNQSYLNIKVPVLVQTGSEDKFFNTQGEERTGPEDHLQPFYELKPLGSHYALNLEGVDHIFGGFFCWPFTSYYLELPDQGPQFETLKDLTVQFLLAFGSEFKDRASSRAKEGLKEQESEEFPTKLIRK